VPKYKKIGEKGRRFADDELPDYHLHCRYCISYGFSMSEAAKLWNDKFKNKYTDRNEQFNLLFAYLRLHENNYQPEKEPPLVQTYFKEGEKYISEVTRRKRERVLVRHRLEMDNYKCQYCGFPTFTNSEMLLNSVLVEIHHINPIQDGERETKIEDLISLCPNCHKLIHAIGKESKSDILSIELLQKYKP
jgi:predicted HNH restriction endonuclease